MPKFLVKMLYLLLAIGYVGSWFTVRYAKEPLKRYNIKLIEYSVQAQDGFKSYRDLKDIELVINDKIDKKEIETEKRVYKSFKTVDSKRLAKELLLGQDITNTALYQRVKVDIEEGFRIDATEDVHKVIASHRNSPAMEQYFKLLISKKMVLGILLLLSFPAFSPLVISVLLKVLISRNYIKKKADKTEINYMEKIPDIYTTNLVFAILSLMVFSFNVYIGLIIAIFTHILFIIQVFFGLRMTPLNSCLYCGSLIKKGK